MSERELVEQDVIAACKVNNVNKRKRVAPSEQPGNNCSDARESLGNDDDGDDEHDDDATERKARAKAPLPADKSDATPSPPQGTMLGEAAIGATVLELEPATQPIASDPTHDVGATVAATATGPAADRQILVASGDDEDEDEDVQFAIACSIADVEREQQNEIALDHAKRLSIAKAVDTTRGDSIGLLDENFDEEEEDDEKDDDEEEDDVVDVEGEAAC